MIEFIDRSGGGKTRRYAWPINDYLCIVPLETGHMIYKTSSGKPFMNINWATKEVAFDVARVLNDVYRDYFAIWETPGWENADIVELLQWTVKNGVDIAKILRDLSGSIVHQVPKELESI